MLGHNRGAHFADLSSKWKRETPEKMQERAREDLVRAEVRGLASWQAGLARGVLYQLLSCAPRRRCVPGSHEQALMTRHAAPA